MTMVTILMKMFHWWWQLHDNDNDDTDGDANRRAFVLFRVTQVLMAQKVNQVLRYVQHNHDGPASFLKLRTGNLKDFCWRTLLTLLTFQEVFYERWLFRWTKCSLLLTVMLTLLVGMCHKIIGLLLSVNSLFCNLCYKCRSFSCFCI